MNMYKLAGKIVDPYDHPEFDADPRTPYLFSEGWLPTRDKLAAMDDRCFAVQLGDSPGTRRYPLHNKVAAEASIRFFDAYGAALPRAARASAGYHLKVAAAAYVIDAPQLAAYDRAPWKPNMDGRELGIVPIEKLAAEQEERVLRQFDNLAPQDLADLATSFRDAHGEHAFTKQAFHDYLPKDHVGPRFYVEMQARRDIVAAEGTVGAEAVDRVVGMAKTASATEMVRLVTALDQACGLDRSSHQLADPHKTCYAGTIPIEKQAAHVETGLSDDPDVDLDTHLRALASLYPRGTPKFDKMAATIKTNIYQFLEDRSAPRSQATLLHFGQHLEPEL